MKFTYYFLWCVAILFDQEVAGSNLNSAEEGRCLAWMVRRVAGVEIPNLPIPTSSGPSRPGKRGPVGLKGDVGSPGPPGTCECDENEMAGLHDDIESLSAEINQLKTEMASVKRQLNRTNSGTGASPTGDDGIQAKNIACTGAVRGNSNTFQTPVTAVRCPSGCLSVGGIWGSEIYTDDSQVCRAAIHNGKITTEGGIVFVKKLPGQSSYASTTANGITSSGYGSWDGSYRFCESAQC